MTLVDAPDAPENVQIDDLTKKSCTLAWQPPAFDGGSPIRGYYIEKCTGYSSRWTKVNREPIKATMMTFDDLIEGSEYNFRVCAENEAGVSKPSEATGTFVAKDPYEAPGKPTDVKVEEITKDCATLAWSPPSDDGGAPITNYVVEMREVGDMKWRVANKGQVTKDASYKMTGLREGASYEFRISAENKAGTGAPSIPSKPAKYGTFDNMDATHFNLAISHVHTGNETSSKHSIMMFKKELKRHV